jgi:hypothetical protein
MNNLWQWLNGKKTVIAEFYWTALAGINLIWFPNGLPPTMNKIYLSIGVILTFIGLGHKAAKKYIGGTEPEEQK